MTPFLSMCLDAAKAFFVILLLVGAFGIWRERRKPAKPKDYTGARLRP